jgi:hypothetical protein
MCDVSRSPVGNKVNYSSTSRFPPPTSSNPLKNSSFFYHELGMGETIFLTVPTIPVPAIQQLQITVIKNSLFHDLVWYLFSISSKCSPVTERWPDIVYVPNLVHFRWGKALIWFSIPIHEINTATAVLTEITKWIIIKDGTIPLFSIPIPGFFEKLIQYQYTIIVSAGWITIKAFLY